MPETTPHNGVVTAAADATLENKAGAICILLRDGRLFGPFPSRAAALYWTVALGLDGFSTYDLLAPEAARDA